MTDERTHRLGERLDEAIDRTVQALMSQDAPNTLRARVMGRLKAAPTRRSPWTLRRLEWIGVAAAVVTTVAVVAPRWWSRPDAPPSRIAAGLTPARPAPLSAPVPPVAPPAVAPVVSSGPVARAARAVRPAADAWAAWQGEQPAFIDPLPALEPITIGALETETIAAEAVAIEPLTLEALSIEPIQVQR